MQPSPMKTLSTKLQSIFTMEQVEFLMQRFEQMKAEGFGRVVVEFKNGHPDILERRIPEKFPQPVKTYQSE